MISQTIDYTSSMLDFDQRESSEVNASNDSENTQMNVVIGDLVGVGASIADYESQLKVKLQAVTDKMLKYMREINFTTIIDFKNQVNNPSKSCYRAAKCLCLLISAFEQQESNSSSHS